jgi:hypothetical protein
MESKDVGLAESLADRRRRGHESGFREVDALCRVPTARIDCYKPDETMDFS